MACFGFDSTVTVTARNLAGEVLFGPEQLPVQDALCAVRQALLCKREGPPQGVVLARGEEVLRDGYHLLSDEPVELTATFEPIEPLPPEEKERYKGQLQGDYDDCWWIPPSTELFDLPEAARADKDLVFKAMGNIDPGQLRHAHPRLRNDPEFVLDAMYRVSDGHRCLEFAGDACKSDHSTVMKAVAMIPKSLQFASEALRDDPEIVLQGVRKDPQCLRFAGVGCRDDRDIVAEAVKKDPASLQHASERLRGDPEFQGC